MFILKTLIPAQKGSLQLLFCAHHYLHLSQIETYLKCSLIAAYHQGRLRPSVLNSLLSGP